MSSAVDVVIVSYRCRELLRRCLASLGSAGGRIVVVDNASGDGTVEMVASEFPDIELVANDANLGFARATNIGLGRCSAPYVLVLNPDTEVRDSTLERLVALMDSRPEIGICGCRLELPDGRLDHAAKRSFPTPVGAFAHLTGVGRRRGQGALAQYRAPLVESGPVDAVNGAFMLIRSSALAEVGVFDERFWMYMEDIELCYRFKQAGWITWYEPSVTALHVKGGTIPRRSSVRLTLAFYAGMWRFVRLHPESVPKPLLRPVVLAGIAVMAAAAVGACCARSAVTRLQPSRPHAVRAVVDGA